LKFSLSSGEAGDGPAGRDLLRSMGARTESCDLIMDKAYEGDETRKLARDLGYNPVVPPKSNRREPWTYDKETYKRRNEVERIFRRIKEFRRVFTRYDKLDVMFSGFVYLSLIVQLLKC
jgi:transposase